MANTTTATSTPCCTKGGVPDLATVNALHLADRSNEAWRHATQLYLVLKALRQKVERGDDITLPEIEAAFDLADDLHNDIACIHLVLGSTEEELGL